MWLTRRRRAGSASGRGSSAGSMSMEMVLLAPIFVAFIVFIAGLGRRVDAQSEVDGAARDAARAASVARTLPEARALAQQVAEQSLHGSGWCKAAPTADLTGTDFRAGGTVTVRVDCDVDLSDVMFLGLFPAGHEVLHGTSIAPIDNYTFRGP